VTVVAPSVSCGALVSGNPPLFSCSAFSAVCGDQPVRRWHMHGVPERNLLLLQLLLPSVLHSD